MSVVIKPQTQSSTVTATIASTLRVMRELRRIPEIARITRVKNQLILPIRYFGDRIPP